MRKFLLPAVAVLVSWSAVAQPKTVDKIKTVVTKDDIKAHLTFLAADEMRGRGTGSPEVAIAANYVATQFAIAGVKMVPGMTSYFQDVALKKAKPPMGAELVLGSDHFLFKTDLLLRSGGTINYNGEIVFLGYGSAEDFAADVKGKVVVTYTGSSDKSTMSEAFGDSRLKYKMAKEKGAAALIEIVTFNEVPWQGLAGFFSNGRVTLDEQESEIPRILMRKSDASGLTALIQQKKIVGSLTASMPEGQKIPGKNIIGLIEGTDPVLKKEYISLTAHYDHVGVQKSATGDSIFNGARDNALGTTAIIEAARYLSKNPGKRSILIIAYCAEEVGLLGSQWYVNHPVIPLENTVFNLDCDGAGYNDKTMATICDLNRTTADPLLQTATAAFGLKLGGDPVPEQNLYERSDNYNFAVKGVPALDYAPGFTSFNDEIMKYYHQAADEVGSLDFDYLEKFIRSYVYASSLIATAPVKPTWKAGDKFEETGKKLYGTK